MIIAISTVSIGIILLLFWLFFYTPKEKIEDLEKLDSEKQDKKEKPEIEKILEHSKNQDFTSAETISQNQQTAFSDNSSWQKIISENAISSFSQMPKIENVLSTKTSEDRKEQQDENNKIKDNQTQIEDTDFQEIPTLADEQIIFNEQKLAEMQTFPKENKEIESPEITTNESPTIFQPTKESEPEFFEKEFTSKQYKSEETPVEKEKCEVPSSAQNEIQIEPQSFLPYSAEEILEKDQKLKVYYRILKNAELFALNNKIKVAIELFSKTESKTKNIAAKKMINENIKVLKNTTSEELQSLYEKKLAEQNKRLNEKKENFSLQDQKNVETIKNDKIEDRLNALNSQLNEALQQSTVSSASTEESQKKLDAQNNQENDEKIYKKLDELNNQLSKITEQNAILSNQVKEEQKRNDENEKIKKLNEEIVDLKKELETIVEKEKSENKDLHKIDNLNSEISELKKSLKELTAKEEEYKKLDNKNEVQKLNNEISRLKDVLEDISDEKDSLKDTYENRLHELEQNLAKNEQNHQERLDQIEDLKDLIKDLSSRPQEVEVYPTTPDVNVDVTVDTAPIAEAIQETTSQIIESSQTQSEREIIADKQATNDLSQNQPQQAAPISSNETKQENIIQKEDEEEDWELISDLTNPNKDIDDQLSDEDIYEKLIQENLDKQKNDFEILNQNENRSQIPDESIFNKQPSDDQQFYDKFIPQQVRVRKELPILKVSYDFTKLPDEVGMSKDKNILEYSFYKYKNLLEKTNELIKKRKVNDALNYYNVLLNQNIPLELKKMIRYNINDINEYLEKYLSADD